MSLLSSFISVFRKNPRYRIHDTWEPDLDSELSLAVSSFYADDAFHEVFGEGRALSKQSITWHFIGLLLKRRKNPERYMVTVRKNGQIKALLAGCLTCGLSVIDEETAALKKSGTGMKRRPVEDINQYEARHGSLAEICGALEDKQLEIRAEDYFSSIRAHLEDEPTAPAHFMITMIAVHPDEQGVGHVRSMLEKLIVKMREIPPIQYINISTYDKSKVALYEHLGFRLNHELVSGDLKAWILRLPLVR